MEYQLKRNALFIIEWGKKTKKEFTINDLNKPYQEKFGVPISGNIHTDIQYALDFLEADGYLLKDNMIHYKLGPKGYYFENWELLEAKIEAEKLNLEIANEKNREDLTYVRKLNRDYKKNQRIVYFSMLVALLSAIASIVSAAC